MIPGIVAGAAVAGGGGGGPGAHRYWRLYITASSGAVVWKGLSELILRDPGGVARQGGGGGAGASASSELNSGNAAALAFDGDTTASGWISSGDGDAAPQSITWDFEASGAYGSPVEVKTFGIYASWNLVDCSPKDFEMRYSDDGSSWTTAASFTGETGWTASELRNFNVY